MGKCWQEEKGMLAFLEEGSGRAKSRWRQHLICRGSCKKSESFASGVRGSAKKDCADEVGRDASWKNWTPQLKSLGFPVRKWESHRRVISQGRRLMPRKPKGQLWGSELKTAAAGLEKRSSDKKCWRLSDCALMFIFLGSRITEEGDCSHEIQRRSLLGRKVMTNLDCLLNSRDITLSTKVCLVKAMVFPMVMYGCESPLDCKEIQPVHPKGDQSWVFTGRTHVEAETPIL